MKQKNVCQLFVEQWAVYQRMTATLMTCLAQTAPSYCLVWVESYHCLAKILLRVDDWTSRDRLQIDWADWRNLQGHFNCLVMLRKQVKESISLVK